MARSSRDDEFHDDLFYGDLFVYTSKDLKYLPCQLSPKFVHDPNQFGAFLPAEDASMAFIKIGNTWFKSG